MMNIKQKMIGTILSLYINFLIFMQKYKRAEKICIRYINKFPKKLLFYDYLANIYLKEGKKDLTLDIYIKTLSLIDNNIVKMQRLIDTMDISYKTEKYTVTVKMANSYLEIKPTSFLQDRIKDNLLDWVYWYLAYSYYNLNQFQEAIPWLERLLNYKGKEDHYLPLAYCYQRTGNYKEAIYYYEKALNAGIAKEKKENTYKNLGICYSEINEIDKAIKIFKKALEIKEDINLRKEIISLYLKSEKLEEAKKFIKMALEKDPEDKFLNELYDKIKE